MALWHGNICTALETRDSDRIHLRPKIVTIEHNAFLLDITLDNQLGNLVVYSALVNVVP